MNAPERHAYRLGSRDRYAGREPAVINDDSALMNELGETSATTKSNADARLAMREAYLDGWHDAGKALG